MLSKLAIALLCAVTLSAAPALAQPAPPTAEPASNSVPAPSSAMTARFTTFFTQVVAGHVPSVSMSSQMRAGFTQQLLGQIDAAFAGLGKFRALQFVSADTMQQYTRYHYRATFEQGSQGIMFVLDSTGSIVGFFQDPSAGNPQ